MLAEQAQFEAVAGHGLQATVDGRLVVIGNAKLMAGLRRSTDKGATWTETTFAGAVLAVAIAWGDPDDVAIVDEQTRFYQSPDGGLSWPAP